MPGNGCQAGKLPKNKLMPVTASIVLVLFRYGFPRGPPPVEAAPRSLYNERDRQEKCTTVPHSQDKMTVRTCPPPGAIFARTATPPPTGNRAHCEPETDEYELLRSSSIESSASPRGSSCGPGTSPTVAPRPVVWAARTRQHVASQSESLNRSVETMLPSPFLLPDFGMSIVIVPALLACHESPGHAFINSNHARGPVRPLICHLSGPRRVLPL